MNTRLPPRVRRRLAATSEVPTTTTTTRRPPAPPLPLRMPVARSAADTRHTGPAWLRSTSNLTAQVGAQWHLPAPHQWPMGWYGIISYYVPRRSRLLEGNYNKAGVIFSPNKSPTEKSLFSVVGMKYVLYQSKTIRHNKYYKTQQFFYTYYSSVDLA